MRRASIISTCAVLLALFLPPISSSLADFPFLPRVRWKWEEVVDPITDEIQRTAEVTTSRGRISGSPPERFVVLYLLCKSGKSGLFVEWDARVATQKNWALEYRFEGQPGHALKAKYVNSKRQLINGAAEIRLFLEEAQVSRRLYVRVRSAAYGLSEASFTAEGGKEMVQRFVTACPAIARE